MPQEPCSILAGTLGFPEPRDKPSDASKEASDRNFITSYSFSLKLSYCARSGKGCTRLHLNIQDS
jgi:hypothetical protein